MTSNRKLSKGKQSSNSRESRVPAQSIPPYTDMERIRQKAQERAERLWHLQRQMCPGEWKAFLAAHPESAEWHRWLSGDAR